MAHHRFRKFESAFELFGTSFELDLYRLEVRPDLELLAANMPDEPNLVFKSVDAFDLAAVLVSDEALPALTRLLNFCLWHYCTGLGVLFWLPTINNLPIL